MRCAALKLFSGRLNGYLLGIPLHVFELSKSTRRSYTIKCLSNIDIRTNVSISTFVIANTNDLYRYLLTLCFTRKSLKVDH